MSSSPYRDPAIPYAVRRSDRARHARIEVDAAGVRVIVPRRMPLGEVAPFVAQKQRWIERTLRRYRQAEAEAPRVRLADGGTVPYLGRDLEPRELDLSRDYSSFYAVVWKGAATPPSFRLEYETELFALYRIRS